ncbi:VOC family protein [Hyphomonas sp.]|uniref:VOC family protein n=1 Tax=Hyphomonas sp. TaxID=87 RepID=UPI00391C584E
MALANPRPPRIEHVNITVPDSEYTARLFEQIFGWHVRWRGPAMNGGHTVHVGSGDHYLALYSPGPDHPCPQQFEKGLPLNHIGIEVDDIVAIEARVREAGLLPFSHADYEPGRRFYFFDESNIEFEIVSYVPVLEMVR